MRLTREEEEEAREREWKSTHQMCEMVSSGILILILDLDEITTPAAAAVDTIANSVAAFWRRLSVCRQMSREQTLLLLLLVMVAGEARSQPRRHRAS